MPQAGFGDLQAAINGFNSSLKEYAVHSAVADATQQVQQLQQQQMDETDKRNQLMQLSNNLALQLTGVGANGTQIEAAMAATRPKAINDYGSLYGEGLAKGSETMKAQAKDWKKFMNEDKMQLAAMKMEQDKLKFAKTQSAMSDNKFAQLVPQVQKEFNKNTKSLTDKMLQIDNAMNLSPSQVSDRIRLTTLVKSVGQDVGNIGEKETSEMLRKTLGQSVNEWKNFLSNSAESELSPAQAKAVMRALKQAKPMLSKGIEAWSKRHAYQLSTSAKGYGHDLTPQQTLEMLAPASLTSGDYTDSAAAPSAQAPQSGGLDLKRFEQ